MSAAPLRPALAGRWREFASARWWLERLRSAWAQPELRWLAAILVLAAALRIAWVIYAAREPQGIHDPVFYYGYGKAMARGGHYALPDGYTAYYPIAYPAVVAGVFALVIHTPIPDNLVMASAFFNVVLGVATVGLLYEVARRLFSPAVGLVAAFWLAVFPNLIYHTATFLTETLFNFLIVAALLVLLGADWKERRLDWWRLGLFGALVAWSALVRPISLLFLPLLPIVWLFAGFGWRRVAAYTGAVVGVTVALIVPWTVRNLIVMDSPVIISTNLGDNLCMGNYAGAPGHFALPDVCFSEAPYVGLRREEFEVRRNNDNTRKAITFALHNPRYELQLLSRKSFYTWNHDHDGLLAVESYGDDRFLSDGARNALGKAADVFFFTTISLGGLGLAAFVVKPRDPRRTFMLLALLAMAGSPLPFFGDARFHIPTLPPLVVGGAWLLVTGWQAAPRLLAQASAPASAAVEGAEGEGPVAKEDALEDA